MIYKFFAIFMFLMPLQAMAKNRVKGDAWMWLMGFTPFIIFIGMVIFSIISDSVIEKQEKNRVQKNSTNEEIKKQPK